MKAKTTAWLQGLAWKVVDQLHKKFAPTDMASKIEMRKMINNVSMKPHEDPATLFEQISAIENMFNVEIDDNDKVAIAMTAAPDEYQGILTSEQNRCAAAGTSATPDQIEYVMNTYWRNVHGKRLHNSAANESADKEGRELVLSTFDGECFICKQKARHRAADCPHRDKKKGGNYGGGGNKGKKPWNGNRKKKFTGKCNFCGKMGHKAVDCWSKPGNNLPGKKGNNMGNIAANQVEFVLMAGQMNQLAFPNDMKLLSNPEIWVVDTGATCNMTPYATGLIKTREAEVTDSVTMGSSKIEKAAQVGDLPVVVCDKLGTELQRVTMRDVVVVPDCGFNLFSVTKRLKEGWTMCGDKNGMWLKDSKMTVRFDIVISTPKGMLFAACLKRLSEVAGVATKKETKNEKKMVMTIQQAHDRLGHMSEKNT
ncbi:hypothetical protein ACA910_011420 [Epithemia clementina (nom. ined.)]